jgi:glycosyltransferase involved in cell wall biosynthesis
MFAALRGTRGTAHWRRALSGVGADVCHLHGVWNPNALFLARAAGALALPIIVSPHGQLMPRLLESDGPLRRAKKLLYSAAAVREVVARATLLHAVSDAEERSLRSRYPGKRIEVLPNLLDAAFFDHREPARPRPPTRTITFLGRVERRKGVADLVNAFLRADLPAGWRLRVIGPQDDPGLARWIAEVGRKSASDRRVEIAPPVSGPERIQAFLQSDIVCLPSRSEVLGLVNIEAALLGRLVITTPDAGIEGLEAAGGVICDSSPDVLAQVLARVTRMAPEEYARRCESLRSWARTRFDRGAIVERWVATLAGLGPTARRVS